jgi:uncharacterized protein (TIGR02231 family)
VTTEHRIRTAITEVTVYPKRAKVSAEGEVRLEAGRHRLVVEGLPLSMYSDSVRARGRGKMPVRLGGVDVRKQFHEETPEEVVLALEREIDELKDGLLALSDERDVLDAQSGYLNGLRAAADHYARGLAKGTLSVDGQRQLVDFVARVDRETRTAIREVEGRRREQERRLHQRESRLRELQSKRSRQSFAIIIDLEADGEGVFFPVVSYDVQHVSWQPLYDIRLSRTADEPMVEVTAFAEIKQSSGQDWTGVALKVSTARPDVGQELPELEALVYL